MSPAAVPRETPRAATYLGADRSSGADFWLAGPHVFSVSADGSRSRRVCGLARFNRRASCRGDGPAVPRKDRA